MAAVRDQGTSKPLRILKGVGALFLVIGTAAAFMGPLEMYSFYLFGRGGRFHYEGFGVGSLMFANIVIQVVGYGLLAAVFITLGVAHLTLRHWARKVVVVLLWCWIAVGIPLVVFFMFALLQAKQLPVYSLPILTMVCLLLYPVIPLGLIRFYHRDDVRKAFEAQASDLAWIDRQPVSVLVHGILFTFLTLVQLLPVLFHGIVPFFGTFKPGLEGFILTDFAVLGLMCLTLGVFSRKMWAWWGSVVYLVLVGLSTGVTLSRVDFSVLIDTLNLPQLEAQVLRGLPVNNLHIMFVILLPLLMLLAVVIRSFGDFRIRTETRPVGDLN